jgi:hypothetical protein
MKNQIWVLLLLAFMVACQQSANKADAAQQSAALGDTPRFVFSKQSPGTSAGREGDWCHLSLPEAAVINADPVNSNRRIFTLSSGPHRVMVDFGNIVASFVLQKKGNQVEIFTSDNFPECLSKHSNFSIGADGTTFHYDNQKHISFDMQLISLPNGTQIALEMAPGTTYGIIVRR